MDITKEWTKKNKKGSVVEKLSYLVNGINYIVDGKHFIFDMTDCSLSSEEIERQIAGVYSSTHTRFVNEIIVMRNGKIIKVHRRK